MKKKSDFKFIIIFILIVGVSLFYLFQSSYAKYKKRLDGEVQARIANWKIKVNNEIINNKRVLENEITPTFDSNEFIKNGVIAPGSTGYFDLTINAEDVDVDFTYTVSCGVDENTPLSDLIITAYEINGVRTELTNDNVVTDTITKNSPDKTIRYYIKWNDDETNTMDNQADTEYAIDENNEFTKIKIELTFNQKNN